MTRAKQLSDTLLREVAVFVEAVDAGSLAAAARVLGIERSAATRDLARLEDSLGRTLAERTAHRFTLTAHGKDFLPAARDILAAALAIEEKMPHIGAPRKLTVSVPGWLSAARLQRAIATFSSRWPDCRLLFEDDTTADIAIWIDGAPVAPATGQVVGSEAVVLVASPALSPPHSPVDLANERFLDVAHTVGARPVRFESADGVCWANLLPSFISSDPRVVLTAAAAGAGIARVPLLLASQQITSGRLRIVLPGFALEPWDVRLAVHARHRGTTTIASVFGQLLADEWGAC